MLEDVEHPSQDDLVVTKEINDSVEEPADDDIENLVGELFDDEFDTLTVEEDNHSVILTETFLTDEIKDLENNGKNKESIQSLESYCNISIRRSENCYPILAGPKSNISG